MAIKAAFLLCLAHTGNVTIAAEFAGSSRVAIYNWRNSDSNFREQWDGALLEAADRLGNIAWQRAVKGGRGAGFLSRRTNWCAPALFGQAVNASNSYRPDGST